MRFKSLGLFLLGAQATPLGKFDIEFNQDWCYLVVKDQDKVVFSADASTLVQVGHGNINDQPQSIIENGNIQWWPKAKQWPVTQYCPVFEFDNLEPKAVLNGVMLVDQRDSIFGIR